VWSPNTTLLTPVQKQVEKKNPGATIIPILLSSDKTQLTMFGNKSAYPVYMTIGNILKETRRKPSRRAYILLAYLPTSRLGHIKNKAARRRTQANLFHVCLSFITAPLREAGVNGISVASGDGKLRRGHPILACYIGDYPEQLLVTCVKTGWCPTGETAHDSLGDGESKCVHRNLAQILDALDTLYEGGTRYTQACVEAGIKPVVHPLGAAAVHKHIPVHHLRRPAPTVSGHYQALDRVVEGESWRGRARCALPTSSSQSQYPSVHEGDFSP
jgi:hypothetical protein